MTEITTLLGWCSIINMGILVFSSVALIIMHEFVSNIHSKIFKIDKSELPKIYFNYLANYKIAVIIFNIAPYLALKIMAS